MNNSILFALVVLLWGATWYAIKLQVGMVDPTVSVAYRFLIAAIVLFVWIKWRKLPMQFSLRQHLTMVLLGGLIFSTNYILFYSASVYLTSGLVAILFSTIVIMNVFNSALFYKIRPDAFLIFGTILGVTGIVITFWHEISNFSLSNAGSLGLLLALGGTFLASLGNVLSMGNQKKGFPVLQVNAFGMLYGSIITILWALGTGKSFTFNFSATYILTLLYLAIPGSIFAFQCYLTLCGRIGASKTAYTAVLIPIFALAVSTIFEGYDWPMEAIVGLTLALIGSVIILNKKVPAYLIFTVNSRFKKLRHRSSEAKIIVDN